MPSFAGWLAAIVAAASLIEARPLQSERVPHEKREISSRVWVKRDRVAPDALLPMKIGLKQQNLEKGYEYLMDV